VRSKVSLISSLTTGCALFDPFISVEQNLSLIADLLKINFDKILRFAELLEIDDYFEYKFGALSTGLAARVVLALNLAKSSEIYLFDEPAEALSPEGRELFKRILSELKREGKTIVYATHHPVELADIFNKVLVLVSGRIVFRGTIEEFLSEAFRGRNACIEVEFRKKIGAEDLEKISLPEVEYTRDFLRLYVNIFEAHIYLSKLLSRIKVDYIKSIKVVPRSLEEAYLIYVKRR